MQLSKIEFKQRDRTEVGFDFDKFVI
jgi:hypothetical protein